MTILDRHIARQYLINILLLLFILSSFVVVVDVSLNLHRFVRAADTLSATKSDSSDPASGPARVLGTLGVIAELWWPRLVQLFNFLLGMVLVAAMGFTCTQLGRHREFVAMLAAGISLQRVARPILLVASAVCLLQLANREFLVPRIAPLLERDHSTLARSTFNAAALPLTADGQGRLFRADAFDPATSTLTGLYILERDPQGRSRRVITADSARWAPSASGEPGWTLTSGRGVSRGSRATAATPPPEIIEHVPTGLGPEEIKLNRSKSFRNAVSFAQASRLLKLPLDPDSRARLERIRWGRFALIAANLLTLLIALPFFVTREPTSFVTQALKCAPITIGALMGGAVGSSAGIPGLPPALAVFIPVMILATVAAASRSWIKT
jgi:lipopolysaccharide export LptBFGC system permease protein LptF